MMGNQGCRPRTIRHACAASALALALAVSPAWGGDAVTQFDLKAQPLARALIAFAQATDMVVIADGRMVRGISAPALRGAMEPLDALARLLDGSGLSYTRGADGAIRIVREAASRSRADHDVQLAQVDQSDRRTDGSASGRDGAPSGTQRRTTRSRWRRWW